MSGSFLGEAFPTGRKMRRLFLRGCRFGAMGSLSFLLAAQGLPPLPSTEPLGNSPDFAELLPYRPLPMESPDQGTEPLDYRGEKVQNDPSGWTIENGALQSSDLLLVARKIHYNPKTNFIVAEGNVRLETPGIRLHCERLEMDWKKRAGKAWALELEVDPTWTIKSDTAAFASLKQWQFEQVQVSSCPQDPPGWSVTMSKLDLNLDHFATFRNAKMHIGTVPVLYLPWGTYPAKSTRSSGLLPTMPKYSSTLGFTLALPYFQTFGDTMDATVEPEFHTRENPLLSGEFRWHPEPTHEGSFGGEYIHQQTDGEYRYRVELQDVWRREDGWQLSTDLNHASDSLVDADYGKGAAGTGANYFDSKFFVGKSFPWASFSVQAYDQQTYFSTLDPSILRQETMPTIQARLYPIRLGNFYWDTGASVGRMAYRLESDTDKPSSVFLWNRADLFTRMQGSLGQWGPFRTELQTLGRYTSYDASLRTPLYTSQTAVSADSALPASFNQYLVDGKPIDRFLASGRFQLSGPPMGRTFEDLHLFRFQGELKHVLEPFAAYTETSRSSVDAEVPRFDDVDSRPGADGSAMGERSLELGVMQHFFGRREPTDAFMDLVRLKVSAKYHFRTILLSDGRYKQGWTSLDTDLEVQPAHGLRVAFRSTSDLEEKHSDNSVSVNVDTVNGSTYSFAYYSTGINRLLVRQHGLQASGLQRFWDDQLRLEFSANYDYERVVTSQIALAYLTPCVAYSVRFTHNALTGVSVLSKENKIEFVVSLRSLGNFSLFGRSY